jgi:putative PIN family toxin of toxin-antitoxin system
MLHLRLVLDTNVVVSGALKPQGLQRTVLNFALTPPALLFCSPIILAEYREVLGRPELRIPVAERRQLMDLIESRSHSVEPSERLDACHDPDDNVFLECAQASRADYLVTGNKQHFPEFWKSTKIVNGRELLSIIAPHIKP